MPAQLPLRPDEVPMGANLVSDGSGATFRCWAPRAHAVWVRGEFNGWARDDASALQRRGDHWVGYLPGVRDGHRYKFFVEGEAGAEWKRDPYARELTQEPAYPQCDCVVRDPGAYPWSDGGFRPPAFNDLIVYQLHVGTFNGPDRARRVAKFLDVLGKLDHLAGLGINAVQLLPIVEFASPRSLGYEGSDLFSPEMDYALSPGELPAYLPLVNGLRARFQLPPHTVASLTPHPSQLKAVVELFHLHGIAVLLDLVYNHAGGQVKGQAQSLWNFEQARMGSDDDSSYFTRQDWTGPVWALWKAPVRQFLIDNAASFVREYHVDGFRYDEVSAIVAMNRDHAWEFCQHLTSTVRDADPSAVQVAEFWGPDPWVPRPREQGGAGFDACWHNSLRIAVRDAVRAASGGMQALVDVKRIAAALWPEGFPEAWRFLHCIENHDEVHEKGDQRIPRLADPGNAQSWHARSRSRVATGLLLTAPGIPMLFMGQELMEDKRWNDNAEYAPGSLIWWDGLDYGRDRARVLFHRFVEAAARLRRSEPALRGDRFRVLHAENGSRVLAFHRWLEGAGRDVVVVASFNDSTFPAYELGWPSAGRWREILNSDAFDDHERGPAGNGGSVEAWWGERDGQRATARLVIPANSILVFAR